MRIVHTLRRDMSTPGQARCLLNELILPDHVHRDGMLLLSELVTNAIRHSDSAGPVQITVICDHVRLRCEVRDGGLSTQLRPLTPDPLRPGGMGLMLVGEIASRWGQQHNPDTMIWFELDFGSRARIARPPTPAAPSQPDSVSLPEPENPSATNARVQTYRPDRRMCHVTHDSVWARTF